MKSLLTLFSFLFFVSAVNAQQLSLEEAIATGLKNRTDAKGQNLQIELARQQNDKIKAQWLPQINGTADVRINTQLQTTILPFDITGQNPGGRSEVKFGLPFNNLLSLQADQKIYDANKKIDRAINNNGILRQELTLEQLQVTIKQSITEAYYSVLLNKERLKVNQEAVARATIATETAEVRFKNGTLLENEYNRFLLDESNAKITLNKAKKDYELSLTTLKYRMNISETQPIEVTDKLRELLTETDYTPAFNSRPEVKSELNALELNKLNEQKAAAKMKPTVSAFANYSVIHLNGTPNIFDFTKWYPYNYIGAKLNLPIFDGKQSKLAARDFKIQQQINENTLQHLQEDFSYEASSAQQEMQQARLDLTQTQQNIDLAQQIYATDKFRYESGTLTLTDLKGTELSLQQSENNYLTAVYNFLVAEVNYRKATGSL